MTKRLEKEEYVAKFLYRNDGNKNLPKSRNWDFLNLFWKEQYRKLARNLLDDLEKIDVDDQSD